MFVVILNENAEKEFLEDLFLYKEEDKISLRYWISYVEEYGILAAQKNPDFRDHSLIREWNGFRAASFGYSARIIYKVYYDNVEIVEIFKITLNHDYNKDTR